MAPLPLAASEEKNEWPKWLISLANYLFPKPKPDVLDKKENKLKLPVLFGLGIPMPGKGEDVTTTTVMWPPEPSQTETDGIWKVTGFASSDEYTKMMSKENLRRSLQDQESPALTVSTSGMSASIEQELGKFHLTISQEISLLIFTWVAGIIICGAIVSVMAKIEKKICLLAGRGVTGFGEKKGRSRALHCFGYGSMAIVILFMLHMFMAVMLSLKNPLR
ncbi:hypothetical protein HOY82DRAFT_595810 [Tuber indicum]|nr:hypothetical protein HOY82DRAFT_595810 [Tuber indicum]